MSFRVTQETLEALEWPQIVAMLREECRTPQGREALAPATEPIGVDDSSEIEAASDAGPGDAGIFERSADGARRRLAETSEARALMDAEDLPPLGGAAPLRAIFQRAGMGGVLEASQILDVRGALQTLHSTARFFRTRTDSCPGLADIAEVIEELPQLEREIDHCIDASGEIRDAASSALAQARRDSQKLASDLQSRLARYLHNPDISKHLSDDYYTVRGDRYVLPVRSDSRSRIRGIVHDASRSGATLFIEPEGVVELNNRLKQAELTVSREIERVLRQLSQRVAESMPSMRASLGGLARIDLACARGRLSQRMEGVAPEVGSDGIFDLPQLRHPLIDPAECVANDVRIGSDYAVLVISGPNAGGKTVAMKSLGLAALCVRAGLHVACSAGARVDLCEQIIAEIGDGQDIGESLSTFSAHMTALARIVQSADRHTLVVMDEIGVGTDPGEGAALAQAILESLANADARVVVTTHYNLLKEMAEVDPRFANASVDFDSTTLMPTYRLHLGTPGASSAATVAARMGMPSTVLDRAEALLQREDRQLDRMLSELSASRATLESEQEQVANLKAENEAVRSEYRSKLERLQERRDQLYRSMRDDLDAAFKQAHGEVARVIRELQRAGSAQQAARARADLLALEERATHAEETAGVAPEAEPQRAGQAPVDWRHAKAGDRVRVQGGREAVLLELPDRKGRVTVQLGGAKLVLPSEQVARGSVDARGGESKRRSGSKRVQVELAGPEAAELGGGTLHCDLRGQRVEEALDRLAEAVDRATSEQRDALRIVHGHGTGALRKAVREHLRASPFVSRVTAADDEDGGDGVTIAQVG
jgi:DNA mismatch repair protein MutS2